MSRARVVMLVVKAFYLDGWHVTPGQHVTMVSSDVRGTMECGLAVPVRLVGDEAVVVPARYPEPEAREEAVAV